MKTLEQILKTAKKKYQEAIRGRDYQIQLLHDEYGELRKPSEVDDYELLIFRKNKFTAEIALLEDVFGTELLQSEN